MPPCWAWVPAVPVTQLLGSPSERRCSAALCCQQLDPLWCPAVLAWGLAELWRSVLEQRAPWLLLPLCNRSSSLASSSNVPGQVDAEDYSPFRASRVFSGRTGS